MIRMLLASARRVDGGVEMTVLSDRETVLPDLGVQVLRFDVAAQAPMLARTQAQQRYVSGYDFNMPLAFLDLDILVTGPLAPLFARPFDVAVTWRRKRSMPINGGVILANNRNPESVRRFFNALLTTYVERFASQAAWWGDQNALNYLIDFAPARRRGEALMTRDGIDYLVLPGSRYNFSPHALRATWRMPRRGKSILHFKSSARKRYMQAYFDAHLSR